MPAKITERHLIALGFGVGVGLALLPDSQELESDTDDSDSVESQEVTASTGPAECPICGETVDPRGLLGHVRFEHDLSTDEAKDRIAEARDTEVTKQ